MICPNCKNSVPDDAVSCDICGVQFTDQQPLDTTPVTDEKLQTYLIPCIIASLCCCQPVGLIAVVFAAQANTCLMLHDVDAARKIANTAKIWFFVTIGLGILAWICYTVLIILQVCGALSR